jgi:fatty-acyl-CoA synthase
VDSTMPHRQLLVSQLFLHGTRSHPAAQVIDYLGSGSVRARTFAEFASTVNGVAHGLRGLRIGPGDVVATMCWNTSEHLAAYFAVPGTGAVLHTLNPRLHEDQLRYIVSHAGDRAIIVSADLLPLLAQVLRGAQGVEHVIVVGESGETLPAGIAVHDFAEWAAAGETEYVWPSLDEDSAAVLCYTTGTTGRPKGVAYSHRSMYLHTLMISTGTAYGFSDADRVMPVVPMFHANAWGWPHAAWLAGSDLLLTGRHLGVSDLAWMMVGMRPTAVAAVPTLWTQLDAYGVANGLEYPRLRVAVAGGSKLSRGLARNFLDRHGIVLTQGWGMTETSPLLSYSRPPANVTGNEILDWTCRSGSLMPGVELRIVDSSGQVLPADGVAVGEIEVRGSTVTAGYFRATEDDHVADRFRDGWLRTGDVGVLAPDGWVDVVDRLKDGIKSGGEWISSVALEEHLLEHPDVVGAVVIAVADARWEERPLACIQLRPGATVTVGELRAGLAARVSRWWLPERWAFVSELPLTSVGKYDKRAVRDAYQRGDYTVITPDGSRDSD